MLLQQRLSDEFENNLDDFLSEKFLIIEHYIDMVLQALISFSPLFNNNNILAWV